jgi:hypothetical protein
VAANVTTIAAFLCSVGHWWGFTSGLIALIIVLLTMCMRVQQKYIYIATVFALICWITNIVEAAQLNCNPDDGLNLNCPEERDYRVFAIIASLLWIAAVGLIFSIPTIPLENATTASSSKASETEMETV